MTGCSMLIRKRLLLISPVLILSFFAGVAAAQEPTSGVFSTPADLSKWETFGSADDEFHIRLPAPPFSFDTARRVKGGGWEKARVYGLYDGGVAYLIVVYDRPRKDESYDDVFGDMKERFLKGWDVSFENEVVIDATPGRHYTLAKGDARGAANVFLKRRHAYMAAAVGRSADARDVERFINSLTMWAFSYEKMRGPDPQPGDANISLAPSVARPGEQPPDYSDRNKYLLPGVRVINPPGEGESHQPPGGVNSNPWPGGDGLSTGLRLAEVSYRLADGDEDAPAGKPIVFLLPEPRYAEESLASGVRVTVKLKALLAASGDVRDVAAVEGGDNEFAKAAGAALRRALFIPAVKDGRAVSRWIVVEYRFGRD